MSIHHSLLPQPNGSEFVFHRRRDRVAYQMISNRTQLARFIAVVALLVFAADHGRADDVSYLDNGTIKIGADLSMGGSITFLAADSGNVNNLVNSADLGRQIQQSYYSGPTPYNPNGTLNSAWSALGWNPIQSGDSYGNRSTVLDWSNTGSELYVKTQPMIWPLDNYAGQCTFETWIQLNGNVATVHTRLTNQRTDTTQQFAARSTIAQELPAVYTIGALSHLVTYAGTQPFTGGATTEIVSNSDYFLNWPNWRATENWAAYVDNSNFGLGVYNPGCNTFTGGFFGSRGSGGASDWSTGYIGPRHYEILDSNIVYDNSYQLIVGNVNDIRNYVYANRTDPRPDYHFTSDRQHWYYVNASDAGFPISDHLHVLLGVHRSGNDRARHRLSRGRVPKLYIRAAYHTTASSDDLFGELYWETDNGDSSLEGAFSENQKYRFAIIADGQYHTYELDLASMSGYEGLISMLRFDPLLNGNAGDYADIQYISYQTIPEPSGIVLLATGLFGLLAYAGRRRTQRMRRSNRHF